jgi:ATP-dependent protease Clp ATPase subunit
VLCLQVDTRDVLFVVGGAFVHLEKLLMDSRHKSSIGFGNKVRRCWVAASRTVLTHEVEHGNITSCVCVRYMGDAVAVARVK